MTVGVLIITHDNIGADLLSTAQNIVQRNPFQTQTIAIGPNCAPENEKHQAEKYLESLDTGEGVLILTDLFGATPCNIAYRLANRPNVKLIAGINLAMLIRIMNYSTLSLTELASKALSAGHDSIFECRSQGHM